MKTSRWSKEEIFREYSLYSGIREAIQYLEAGRLDRARTTLEDLALRLQKDKVATMVITHEFTSSWSHLRKPAVFHKNDIQQAINDLAVATYRNLGGQRNKGTAPPKINILIPYGAFVIYQGEIHTTEEIFRRFPRQVYGNTSGGRPWPYSQPVKTAFEQEDGSWVTWDPTEACGYTSK